MKIIFLDFDGVLNSHKWMEANQQLLASQSLFMHRHVDRDAVARVQKICDATDAKIVVSSTWRRFNAFEQLQAILRDHGLTSEVIGTTPVMGTARGHEIAQWLTNHSPIESFVILDDDSDMVHLKHRLVQTTFEKGLQDEHVDAAIKILNLES